MLVSVTYPYEDEVIVKVIQKIIIDDILYIVYKTDHIIIAIINPYTLVIHDKYHMNKSIVDAHITSRKLDPHSQVFTQIILLLEESNFSKVYIYNSFDNLKVSVLPNEIENLAEHLYKKIIFNNYTIDVKIPKDRVFSINGNIYVCGYNKFYYIQDVMNKIIYVYNLDIADNVMQCTPNDIREDNSKFINLHYHFTHVGINDLGVYTLNGSRKIIIHYHIRDEIEYYVTDRFFFEYGKNDTIITPIDIYIKNNNIVLVTNEHKFIFESDTKKLIKETISQNKIHVEENNLKVMGDDKLIVLNNNIIFTDINHININNYGYKIFVKVVRIWHS